MKDFDYAVNEWSKILGIALSIVPTFRERQVIIKNLLDENGEKPHTESYKEFIDLVSENLNYQIIDQTMNAISTSTSTSTMGKGKQQNFVRSSSNSSSNSSKHVEKFVQDIYNIFGTHDWTYSIAVLGMIEYMYVDISQIIHHFIKKFTDCDIPHYSLHETLDVTHALELFSIVAPHVETNSQNIRDGLTEGYKIFNDFFNSLYHDSLLPTMTSV